MSVPEFTGPSRSYVDPTTGLPVALPGITPTRIRTAAENIAAGTQVRVNSLGELSQIRFAEHVIIQHENKAGTDPIRIGAFDPITVWQNDFELMANGDVANKDRFVRNPNNTFDKGIGLYSVIDSTNSSYQYLMMCLCKPLHQWYPRSLHEHSIEFVGMCP